MHNFTTFIRAGRRWGGVRGWRRNAQLVPA